MNPLPAVAARIFDDPARAEEARQALLEAGFGREQVQLAAQGDEAGALKGNFVAGNPKTGAAANGAYGPNHEKVEHPRTCVLSVQTGASGRAQAEDLMSSFGGRRVDDLTRTGVPRPG